MRERERELKMERNRRQHTRVSIKPPRARKSRDVEIPATTGQPEYLARICVATILLHFTADRTISQLDLSVVCIFYEPGCWWTHVLERTGMFNGGGGGENVQRLKTGREIDSSRLDRLDGQVVRKSVGISLGNFERNWNNLTRNLSRIELKSLRLEWLMSDKFESVGI